jgi:fructose-1,6-bisphosphatase/inositol monophosphatase family enzyme
VAEAAARAASEIVLRARPQVLASRHAVQQKAGGEGPVTEADLAADRCIREHIVRSFPDDHVVTEESFSGSSQLPTAGRVWLVDPLDGEPHTLLALFPPPSFRR